MIVTIEFEDQGQDFLTWKIDTKTGVLMECKPFQHSLWSKWTIRNKRFQVGKYVHIVKGTESLTIKYPIAKVTKEAKP